MLYKKAKVLLLFLYVCNWVWVHVYHAKYFVPVIFLSMCFILLCLDVPNQNKTFYKQRKNKYKINDTIFYLLLKPLSWKCIWNRCVCLRIGVEVLFLQRTKTRTIFWRRDHGGDWIFAAVERKKLYFSQDKKKNPMMSIPFFYQESKIKLYGLQTAGS